MRNSRDAEWPVEPDPCVWELPDPHTADENGIAGIGADLAPGTLLAAYRNGLFPMPLGGQSRPGPMGWWSPDPRGIVPLDGLRVTRSLRRSCARYEIRVDTAFEAVIDACAEPGRTGGWITAEVRDAYVELHRLGWAHSVEAWELSETVTPPPESTLASAARSSPVLGSKSLRYTGNRFQELGGRLVGGLYGVAIGGLFAGESMFHTATDASKAALVALVDLLRDDRNAGAGRLLDVQWATEHLESLGAVEVPRDQYLRRLAEALPLPLPGALSGTDSRA